MIEPRFATARKNDLSEAVASASATLKLLPVSNAGLRNVYVV